MLLSMLRSGKGLEPSQHDISTSGGGAEKCLCYSAAVKLPKVLFCWRFVFFL